MICSSLQSHVLGSRPQAGGGPAARARFVNFRSIKRYDRIIVIGSLAFDHIMNLPGRFSDWIMPDKIHQLNVSFTVSSLRQEYGGTGGNCAYSLGLLGANPGLIGILGKDGDGYKAHLVNAGVNVERVVTDKKLLTASGHVMTDMDNNQIWSFYPGPLAKSIELRVADYEKNDTFWALLPSEPTVFRKHLNEVADHKAHFMFDPAFFIPNLSKEVLGLGIEKAEIVIGNDYEIALMEKKVNRILREWITGKKIVIKTLGAKGSEIYTKEGVIRIPAAHVNKVVDPTGAGDAYRAGFLAEYIKGSKVDVCGQMGAKIAALTVEKYGTQTHKLV